MKKLTPERLRWTLLPSGLYLLLSVLTIIRWFPFVGFDARPGVHQGIGPWMLASLPSVIVLNSADIGSDHQLADIGRIVLAASIIFLLIGLLAAMMPTVIRRATAFVIMLVGTYLLAANLTVLIGRIESLERIFAKQERHTHLQMDALRNRYENNRGRTHLRETGAAANNIVLMETGSANDGCTKWRIEVDGNRFDRKEIEWLRTLVTGLYSTEGKSDVPRALVPVVGKDLRTLLATPGFEIWAGPQIVKGVKEYLSLGLSDYHRNILMHLIEERFGTQIMDMSRDCGNDD